MAKIADTICMKLLRFTICLCFISSSLLIGCGDLMEEIKENQKKNKEAADKKKDEQPKKKVSCYELDRRHEQCSDDYVNGRISGHHACLVMYERYLDCCVTETHVCYDK